MLIKENIIREIIREEIIKNPYITLEELNENVFDNLLNKIGSAGQKLALTTAALGSTLGGIKQSDAAPQYNPEIGITKVFNQDSSGDRTIYQLSKEEGEALLKKATKEVEESEAKLRSIGEELKKLGKLPTKSEEAPEPEEANNSFEEETEYSLLKGQDLTKKGIKELTKKMSSDPLESLAAKKIIEFNTLLTKILNSHLQSLMKGKLTIAQFKSGNAFIKNAPKEVSQGSITSSKELVNGYKNSIN